MEHLSWQHNFVKLYTEYKNTVEGYYQFIPDLDQWTETRTQRPLPPGFVEETTQSKIEGIKSCTKKAQLQYLNCQTQVKDCMCPRFDSLKNIEIAMLTAPLVVICELVV